MQSPKLSWAGRPEPLPVGAVGGPRGVGNADGAVPDELDITHDKVGFEKFFNRVAVHERALNLPVVVAKTNATLRNPWPPATRLRVP